MSEPRINLQAMPGPIILAGDEQIAFRDPLLHHHDGIFRLFCSVVRARPDGNDRFHVGVTESRDLCSWGPLRARSPVPTTRAVSAGRAASCATTAAGCCA